MHFAVLGPVEVRGENGPCAPTSPMARQVLLLLLAHANRVVPLEKLVEELWGDSPPRLARKTVQTYIYQVRKALREGERTGDRPRVATEPRGYRIRVEKGEFDLWRFQELCRQGQAAQMKGDAFTTSAACDEALSLWRGQPFSGVSVGTVLAAHQARWEDLRMGTLEHRIEADMTLGRHRELLSELKGLAVDFPLNEVICGQLMRAAWHSGQRQVALDAFSRLRVAMVDELGLEPSATVKEVQQDILQDGLGPTTRPLTPAPAPAEESCPATSPAELPAKMADCVAQEHEVAAILAALGEDEDQRSAVPVALVTGGTGTGKTVTAVQAAHHMRPAYPGGQLFTTLHHPDGTPVPTRNALASLLLSSGHSEHGLPDSTEDMARLFRSWTSTQRMLVVLDDAHSREQVLPLLPSSPGCAVIVSSRRHLEGLPGKVTGVSLSGMTGDEGVALLGGLIGTRRVARELHAARELVQLYHGLPLAVRALGRRLSAWPQLPLADLLRRALRDPGRLAVLEGPQDDGLHRLRSAHLRLPRDEQQLLHLLCRLPQPLGEHVLLRAVEASGQSVVSLRRRLESLADAHFIQFHHLGGRTHFRVPELTRLVVLSGDGAGASALRAPARGLPEQAPGPRPMTPSQADRRENEPCGSFQ
ncbi:BTAD domain-containing putative transcriptional regulator [Streptomyces sp. QL37]|uniref:AfsR/SARP family transcriptional regulator n=1 Tax=Streptomyces sp. QL37 TaxID=2093747 RepID=UPI000CF23E0B|nr:AfsR/SARP family transcriptional regulator [Streptomyces sp. QL37]PPQ57504.1 hypothetical protein C5F59_12985 [Streptomyces sp. QL37]